MEYSAPAVASTGPFRTIASSNGIISGNDEVSEDNKVFTLFTTLVGVASQFPHVQMFNPIGSGVVLLIDYVVYGPVANTVVFEFCNRDTELAIDLGVWQSRSDLGANGVCHLREETNVVQLGTVFDERNDIGVESQDSYYPFPIIKQPGEGFLIRGSKVNVTIEISMTGREI